MKKESKKKFEVHKSEQVYISISSSLNENENFRANSTKKIRKDNFSNLFKNNFEKITEENEENSGKNSFDNKLKSI